MGLLKKHVMLRLKMEVSIFLKWLRRIKNIPLLQEFRKSKNVQTKNKSMFLD